MASDLIEDDPKEPSSPACLAHEADDAYMGFATAGEIAAFLKDIDRADAGSLRKMLPRLRDDVLHRELSARLQAIETAKSKT